MTADSFSSDRSVATEAATGAASDRDLLELAAKAADMRIDFEDALPFGDDIRYFDYETGGFWNPLVGDGDALRLVVKLRLDVEFANDAISANDGGFGRWPIEAYGDDPFAATRRAIVRAAAELGKSSGTVQTPTADLK